MNSVGENGVRKPGLQKFYYFFKVLELNILYLSH